MRGEAGTCLRVVEKVAAAAANRHKLSVCLKQPIAMLTSSC